MNPFSSTLLSPPYVLDTGICSVKMGNAFAFRMKISEGTIMATHYSEGFGLAVIFSVLFHSVLLPIMVFKNISFFNPNVVFLSVPISVLICFLFKKYQTKKVFALFNEGKVWKGTFDGFSFEFQQCCIISSNLIKTECGDLFRRPHKTSQIYFISDEMVVFSFCFGTVADNFAKVFKKAMSSDAYKGHFAGAYWSSMENYRNQLKAMGRDEK